MLIVFNVIIIIKNAGLGQYFLLQESLLKYYSLLKFLLLNTFCAVHVKVRLLDHQNSTYVCYSYMMNFKLFLKRMHNIYMISIVYIHISLRNFKVIECINWLKKILLLLKNNRIHCSYFSASFCQLSVEILKTLNVIFWNWNYFI